MRALLLAAGFGSRLRPLTDSLPKCLVPIHGRPLLDYWLDLLHRHGIAPVRVNTHYRAEQVRDYIAGSRYQGDVEVAHESSLLGTAGTLRAHLDFFGQEDALLVHADNYCWPDLSAFAAAHRARPQHCLMSMMTFETAQPSTCGIVELDAQRVVVGFHEKVAHPPGNTANGAIYLLGPELLRQLRTSQATDFSTEVLPGLVGRIYAHATDSPFMDIGTPETYAHANAIAALGGMHCANHHKDR